MRLLLVAICIVACGSSAYSFECFFSLNCTNVEHLFIGKIESKDKGWFGPRHDFICFAKMRGHALSDLSRMIAACGERGMDAVEIMAGDALVHEQNVNAELIGGVQFTDPSLKGLLRKADAICGTKIRTDVYR